VLKGIKDIGNDIKKTLSGTQKGDNRKKEITITGHLVSRII